MPTYHEVMNTDLSTLTAAAAKWEAMAGRFETLETTYQKKVQSITNDGTWTGFSASAAAPNSARTRHEFDAAQKEARAVASILRDAHTRLTELVGKVKAAVKEAEASGMTVTFEGRAYFDSSKAERQTAFQARHDPDLPDVEAAWSRNISNAVQAVSDCDYSVKLTLRDAAKVNALPWASGFNADAKGTLQEHKPPKRTEKPQPEKGGSDRSPSTLIKALGHAAHGFSKPGDFGTKLVTAAIEGLAGATDHNNTQGITFGISGGLGVGIGAEFSLLQTRNPDGGTQINFLYSGTNTTWGWDFGLSGGVGIVKSNADDISQLKGTGWDKGGSFHAGIGMWGGHQNAIGATNSEGAGVTSVSGGVGVGLGTETSTGFTQTDGVTLWQSDRGKEK